MLPLVLPEVLGIGAHAVEPEDRMAKSVPVGAPKLVVMVESDVAAGTVGKVQPDAGGQPETEPG
jgi:hypothetical protein